MKPRSSKSRNSKSGSGLGKNLAQALASPFISRASSPIIDQGPNINLPLSRPRPNPGKRGLSDTFYNPNLPSPSQTHNTDGLHERVKGAKYHVQSAHISPSSKVLLDLNTQLRQKRRKGGHRVTVSADGMRGSGGTTANYPGEGTVGKNDKKNNGQQRERRPSAPSSYSLRPRHPALPLVSASVGLQGNKNKRSRLAPRLEITHNVNNDGVASTAGASATAGIPTAASANHTIDDDGFVMPLFLDSHNKNTATANFAAAPDVEMDWRVGIVDFNRPPSQMCHYSTTIMSSGWAGGDVFSSSGSEGSSSSESEDHEDEEIKGTQPTSNPTRASRTRTRTARPLTSGSTSASGSAFDDFFGFGFGFGSVLPFDSNSNLAANLDLNLHMDLDQSVFGEGAWGISTPLRAKIQGQARLGEKERKEKRVVAKANSNSNLRSKNGGLVKMRSLPVMSSIGGKTMELDVNVNEEDEQEQERDMDLTTPLITATTDTAVPPITLQLVDGRGDRTPWIMDSIISPPTQFLKTQGEIGKCGNDGDEEYVQDQDQENILSSRLSSSPSSEHSILSSPFRLTSDTDIQLQSQSAVTPSTITAATSFFTAKRTRSGTIVPASHRIGNISSNSTNINTNDPPGMRRTRSGTLVGPLSLPLPLAASGPDMQPVVGNGNLPVRRARERSGSILAGLSPLPLLVGAGVGSGTRRTRSGTVVGRAPPPIPVSASVTLPVSVSVSVSALGGRSTKETGPVEDTLTTSNLKSSESGNMDGAAEHLADDTLDETTNGEADVEADTDVEPHIDALYMPRLSPSPDPIDFLRLAHLQDYDGLREKLRFGSRLTIEEREDEDPNLGGGSTWERMKDELTWCIADEPPSPILLRNDSKLMIGQSQVLSGGGRGGRNSSVRGLRGGDIRGHRNGNDRGRRGKGQGETMWRTRFMIGGHEKQPDEVVVEREEGEDSDDELLLKDGSTLDIWE